MKIPEDDQVDRFRQRTNARRRIDIRRYSNLYAIVDDFKITSFCCLVARLPIPIAVLHLSSASNELNVIRYITTSSMNHFLCQLSSNIFHFCPLITTSDIDIDDISSYLNLFCNSIFVLLTASRFARHKP